MKKIIITEDQLKSLSNQIKEQHSLAGNSEAIKWEDAFKKALFKLAVLMVRYDEKINNYPDLVKQIREMTDYYMDSHNYTGFMDVIIPEFDRKRKK